MFKINFKRNLKVSGSYNGEVVLTMVNLSLKMNT